MSESVRESHTKKMAQYMVTDPKDSDDRKGVVIFDPKGFESKNEDSSKLQISTETLNIDKRCLVPDAFNIKEEPNFEEASNESEMFSVTDTDMSKPKMSYAKLISEALLNSPNGMLVLSDIYGSISARHPYYKMNVTGWQNSIRHNLTLNQSFVKCTDGPSTDKRGSYWKLSENLSKSVMKNLSEEELSKLQTSIETLNTDKSFIGAKYLVSFSSHSLKTREKYISFDQLVLISLYIF